jgi:hypothetical protein
MLLTVNPHDNATYEKDSLKLTLEDFGSERSLFKIEPGYKFQSEGDGRVFFGDKIVLESVTRELNRCSYVHSAAVPSAPLGFQGITQATMSPGKMAGEASMEINASLDQRTMWTVDCYEPYKTESSHIFSCGDYVWISHSEEDASLVVESTGDSSKIKFSPRFRNTNGLFKIEGVDVTIGGMILMTEKYRLRHLSSGQYLGAKPF